MHAILRTLEQPKQTETVLEQHGTAAFGTQDILGRVVKGLGLGVSEKVLAHPDSRAALRAVLRAWLPLSEAVLGAAVDQLPSPIVRRR